MMPVVDEYSRECLITRGRALDHRRGCGRDPSIPVSPKERTRLHPLGQSEPGLIARAIRRWLEAPGVKTLYIEPGSPWENAYLRRRSSVAFQTSC
jgi:putative transposase